MINTLAAYIKTQLETITDLTGKVYIQPVDNVEYPAAIILFTGTESEWVSNRTTWRTYRFKIQLTYDIGSGSLSDSLVDSKLYDLADSVLDKFEVLRGAGGVADICTLGTGTCGWLDNERQLRYNDVLLDFKVTRAAS